jgi:hypothetical protein
MGVIPRFKKIKDFTEYPKEPKNLYKSEKENFSITPESISAINTIMS